MRRLRIGFALACALAVGSAGAVVAANVPKTCSNSEFEEIALLTTWQHGDPVPGPGVDAWWDLTVAGFAAEGLTPEDAATLFGFATVDELYEAINTGINGLDKNGDGAVCWKPFPDTSNGKVAYIFNAVDNNAREH